MKRPLLITFCLCWWILPTYGQFPPGLPQQDCFHAIPLCDSLIYEANSYLGEGQFTAEIDSSQSCLGRGERNGAWYLIHTLSAGDICFTITPDSTSHDIDFSIFNLTHATCQDIATRPELEVACNFINIGGSCDGITGADGAISGFCGAQHTPCVSAQKGETYALYLSSYLPLDRGYTLDFRNSTAQLIEDKFFTAEARLQMPQGNRIQLNFSKPVSCQELSSQAFSFSGASQAYAVQLLPSDDCGAGSDFDNQFVLEVQPPIDLGDLGGLTLEIGDTLTDMCGYYQSMTILPLGLEFEILSQPNLDTLCSSDLLELSTDIPSHPNIQKIWTPLMDTAEVISPDLGQDSSFEVMVFASDGSLLGSKKRAFEVLQGPEVFLGDDSSLCPSDILTISASGSFDNLTWSTSDAGNQIQISEGGLYWVEARTENGCRLRDSISIDILELPEADFMLEGSDLTYTLIALCESCTSFEWQISDGSDGIGMETTHTFPQKGSYTITLRVENKCGKDSLSQNFKVGPTSSDKPYGSSLSIYPNPAKTYIYLASATAYPSHFRIMDLRGREVGKGFLEAGDKTRVDLTHLSPGIYSCEIIGEGNRFVEKILIGE